MILFFVLLRNTVDFHSKAKFRIVTSILYNLVDYNTFEQSAQNFSVIVTTLPGTRNADFRAAESHPILFRVQSGIT